MKIILNADSDFKRTKGLMHHRPILKDECAFFEFPRCGKYGFWNNNVDFPISLVFCDNSGKVRDIKKLEAQQKEVVYPNSYDIKYVVETHIDAPKQENIKIGNRLKLKDGEVVFHD